eukprot:Blabericola_migrator_1__9020@NODE_47_length_16538_cov_123_101147_g43_i0_p1_GENE_NODE_47_length_16538_cov_123_101147_g43_i0NODE_47_length_16538_cov_123_101147_g43_i0_p1_ORF_typecomplete_len706_score122_28Ferlin_C/PF16165_5/2e02Ferlin_C/PF16165_5/1_5e12C2/PF00168_30/0_007C2/PF00168_30/3e05_NODE_47_length_16538_cov_123_101147_g43_i033835500
MVDFFLIGVRLFENVGVPRVKISYGRDIQDSGERLWSVFSTNPVSGAERSFNWLQTIKVGLELPKRHIHCAYLEVEAFEENSDLQEARLRAYIPLTEILPWLSVEEREFAADMFKPDLLEFVPAKMMQVEQQAATGSTVFAPLANDDELTSLAPRAKVNWGGTQLPPVKDPERANFETLDRLNYLAPDETASVRSGLAREGSASEFYVPQGGGAETVTKETIEQEKEIYGFRPAQLLFHMSAPEEGELTEDEKKDVIPENLETEFLPSDIPYKVAPLLRAARHGPPERAGSVKYLIRVTQGVEEDKEDEAYLDLKQRMAELVVDELVARVYVLSIRGLVADRSTTASSFYMCLMNESTTIQLPGGIYHYIKDTSSAKEKTQAPVYNKCYNLATDLPRNSVLSMSLMQTGAMQDEVVGSTHVDLEDRWWNPEYRKMVSDGTVPIEQRHLRRPGEPLSRGILRVWVDLLTKAEAQSRPVASLSNAEAEPFQLRVVVWGLRGLPMGDSSTISFSVQGAFRKDDDQLDTQWTDTHFNSKDGTGVFNWRFVWDFYIPSRFQNLKMSVHHHALVGVGDLIGEVEIDLTSDFSLAKKKCRLVDAHQAARTWMSLVHPSFSGQSRGEIEFEFSIVSGKEAMANSVGKGREEPNRNPHLEAVSDNRTYVDWVGWGDSIKTIGASIMKTTKWYLYAGVALFVLASIVFLVFMIKR